MPHKEFIKKVAVTVVSIVAEEAIRYILTKDLSKTPNNKVDLDIDLPKIPKPKNK